MNISVLSQGLLSMIVGGRKRRPKNMTQKRTPPSKLLMNVKKRLYQPELCKKQQDFHLSINLTRVFIFYKKKTQNVENYDPPQNH